MMMVDYNTFFCIISTIPLQIIYCSLDETGNDLVSISQS